jgi:hypothetical protein
VTPVFRPGGFSFLFCFILGFFGSDLPLPFTRQYLTADIAAKKRAFAPQYPKGCCMASVISFSLMRRTLSNKGEFSLWQRARL